MHNQSQLTVCCHWKSSLKRMLKCKAKLTQISHFYYIFFNKTCKINESKLSFLLRTNRKISWVHKIHKNWTYFARHHVMITSQTTTTKQVKFIVVIFTRWGWHLQHWLRKNNTSRLVKNVRVLNLVVVLWNWHRGVLSSSNEVNSDYYINSQNQPHNTAWTPLVVQRENV